VNDDFGQTRASVTTRELVICVFFLALVAVGTWTVALPALDQDTAKQADDTKTPEAPNTKP